MSEHHRGAWGAREDALWWQGEALQQHQQFMQQQQQLAQQQPQHESPACSSPDSTQQMFSYKMASSFQNPSTTVSNVSSTSPLRGYDYRLGGGMTGGNPAMSTPAPAAQWWYPPSSMDNMHNSLQNLQNSMQHSIQQQQQSMPPAQTPPPAQNEAQSRQEEAQRQQQEAHSQHQEAVQRQQEVQRQHQEVQRQHQEAQRQHQEAQRHHQEAHRQQQEAQRQYQEAQQRHQQEAHRQQQEAIQQHQQQIAEAQARHQQQAHHLQQQIQQHSQLQQQNQNNHHQQPNSQQQTVLQHNQQISSSVQTPIAVKGRMPRAKADQRPRGRMTAYAFFVQTCREEHKKKHPEENVVFAEFSKKCAERWKTMLDKEKKRFHEMAENDKKRYDTEMQSYTPPKGEKPRGKKRKQVKDPNAPKRSLSAFFWFSNDERGKVKAQNPEYGVGDIAKELGRRWADADPETKGKFEALADKDKARYEKEMTAYKKKLNPTIVQATIPDPEEADEEEEEVEDDEDD